MINSSSQTQERMGITRSIGSEIKRLLCGSDRCRIRTRIMITTYFKIFIFNQTTA
jgi:hypothetical protein